MLGALGVGGYLAWQWYNNQAAAAAAQVAAGATPTPATPDSTPAATAPVGSATPVSPAAPAANTASVSSLDSLYTELYNNAKASGIDPGTGKTGDGSSVGPDGWNYYLAALYGKAPMPDPTSVFPGVDRSAPMPIAVYWGEMSKWLASIQGLSGLGIFGGLGALAARYR